MNEKDGVLSRIADFAENKGFYIILMLCLLAIGISGYVLFFLPETEEDMGGIMPSAGEIVPDSTPEIPDVTVKIEEEEKPVPKAEEKPQKPKDEKAQDVWIFKKPEEYLMPVSGEIIRGFSMDELIYDRTMGDWRTHNGTDISCAQGDEVKAICGGKVENISEDSLLGTTVIISHGEDLKSVYSGLAAETDVSAGDEVKTGTVIGKAGGTMKTESLMEPHIHLSVIRNGEYIDPESLKLR